MVQRTELYEQHLAADGKMVDFAGWEMPIHYGSQVKEHHQVRQAAGMFDVSHMVVVDLKGDRVSEFLRYLLANDVARLKTSGKALYSCMLNEQGGVIDDLITYFLTDSFFRIVVNAATREKDLAWIRQYAAAFDVAVNERSDLAMLAVQGPEARDKMAALLSEAEQQQAMALKPFFGAQVGRYFIARTGYTGEDGFEVMVDCTEVGNLWEALLGQGVKPCGLGARDTLRLEAGMNLYGSDMDETLSPLESGLGWTVAFDPPSREFMGRNVLDTQRVSQDLRKFVGLVLKGRGVLRAHQKVVLPDGSEGEITSGTFSPTLQRSIAMARVPNSIGDHCSVEIRGKCLPAQVVKMPFVRHGKSLIDH
ncbi:MAG TPA: glycine cleavage system aminomethyltransferase GcvT [Gammaproteobacteria bacterium]|nr:glycine cleavage system aminomethyltransferase GcvT [Gammaproteobacteria bacterium]